MFTKLSAFAVGLLLLAANSALAAATINIANAPEWQASHAYATTGHLGNRVLSGPALVVPTTYTNNTPLYLWELVTAGTSASSGNGPQSCPTPGTSTATDGTAVWKCITIVDYITFNNAMLDDPVVWQPHTGGACTGAAQAGCYYKEQLVRNGNTIYFNYGSGLDYTVSPHQCTSASSGSGPPAADGNCAWGAVQTIYYSSGRSTAWAHQWLMSGAYGLGGRGADVANTQDYTFNNYHGGTARPRYVGGQNNELSGGFGQTQTILLASQLHQDFNGVDATPGCIDGNWPWYTFCYHSVVVQGAPGDSICDNPAGTVLYPDSSKGTTFASVQGQESFFMSDNSFTANCLQFVTTGNAPAFQHQNPAVGGQQHNNNGVSVTNSIIDGNSSTAIVTNGSGLYYNDLIIVHNEYGATGSGGLLLKYASNATLLNLTIISTGGGTDSSCIIGAGMFSAVQPVVENVHCYGFQNAYASVPTGSSAPGYNATLARNNSTDLANTTAGGTFTPANDGSWAPFPVVTRDSFCMADATCASTSLFSRSLSSVFVQPNTANPSPNFQLSSGSSSRGAGVSYNTGGVSNALDLFGATRSPTFDIGPVQFATGALPFSGPGRRMIR